MLTGWTREGVAHRVITGQVLPDAVPSIVVSGQVRRQIWQVQEASQTSLQMMDDLVAQVESTGLAQRFRCASDRCGGFDFRVQAPIEPPPTMFVNLADFHYAVLHNTDETRWLTLLVSRSGPVLFLEVTEVSAPLGAPVNPPPPVARIEAPPPVARIEAPADDAAQIPPAPSQATPLTAARIAEARRTAGHLVIPNLVFSSGSGALDTAAAPGLAALAAFLNADPTRRIALVGHSDATGELAVNRQISRQRARQVRAALIAVHGINPAQIEAYGAAWLAPVTENLTAEGRAANRRVEVVFLE